MLKTKVIASDITNLTDARYFAARGVDYLLFKMEDVDIDTITSIKEWVSGPKILLHFTEATKDIIDESVLKIEPYALSTSSADVEILSYLNGLVKQVLFDEIDEQIDIEIDEISFTSKFTLSSIIPSGIIVQGSDETKVGFKSYDELDDLFDSLEID